MPKRDSAHMMAQRERIVRAAIECIGEKGIETSTISDICRKADLSPGAIYVHFANKDEIILAALRYGVLSEALLPDTWEGFKRMASSLDDQLGFNITTVVRARLHLLAASAQPGKLRDSCKSMIEDALGVLSGYLLRLANCGEIALRLSPRQTALNIIVFIDGMLWIGLATDRTMDETRAHLAQGLDMLVTPLRTVGGASQAWHLCI